MSKQKVLITVFFWLCLYARFFSQVTITPTIDCAPALISVSAPPGANNWDWGDGTTPSTFASGTHAYPSAGTYVINYTGPGGPVSQTIVVPPNNLTTSFTYIAAASGCLPRAVNFTAAAAGPGVIYQWAFGDGGPGTGSVVSHSYVGQGSFNATLTVIDPAQCTATFVAGPINVSSLPNLFIDANPGLTSCLAPFTTSFSASNSTSGSPLGGNLTYNWAFGNGQNSGQVNPGAITYNQGVFNVTLTGTDNNNCTNTVSTTVSVVQPTVSVSTPTIRCIRFQNPGNMINEPVIIQSTQTSALVDMGDGNPPFNVTPLGGVPTFTYPLYTTPGTKTITVLVSAGTCTALATQTLIVEQIVPQFTTSAPFFTCMPVLISNYTNQSTVNTNATLSYTWHVRGFNKEDDPSNLSTQTNPTFTFTQKALNPYTIFGLYKPEVNMIVQSSTGCKTSIMHIYDSIGRPTAWFNKSTSQGCAPLTVTYRDTSDFRPAYPIVSYTWSNGASPPTYSSGLIPPPNLNPSFTYTAPGIYYPSYTISTVGGCGDVSYVDTVIVVDQQSIDIAFPPLSVCAGVPMSFTLSTTPASTLISHWHVDTDDGYYSGCITNPTPSFPFTHIGVHSVTLTGSDHGCKSTLMPVQTVTVNGPVGKFSFRTFCTANTTASFFTYLRNAESATLDFGDGQAPTPLTGNANAVATATTTHVYNGSGDYTVTLNSYNSITNCAYTYSAVVYIRKINASFTLEPVVCLYSVPEFDASSSTDVNASCGGGYTWYMDNLPPEQNPVPQFPIITPDTMKTVGIHNITLVVKDINGCKSSVTKNFRVAHPQVDFAFNSNPICTNNTTQIFNLTPQTPDVVKDYTVNLGTGQSPLALSSLTVWPLQNNYQVTLPPSRIFTVTVIGMDAIGCLDTMQHTLKVNFPFAYIFPTPAQTCVNLPVIFTVPTGYTNTINYGVGPSVIDPSGAGSYTHAFTSPGIYTVSLGIVDDGLCTAADSKTVSVQPYPVADFVFADAITPSITSAVFCTPANVTFSSTSIIAPGYSVVAFDWSVPTITVPIISVPNITTFFDSFGVHTVTLTAYTSNGCSSTVTHTLSILSVTAVPHVNKPKVCLGDAIQLSLSDTTSVQYWNWSFNRQTEANVYAAASPSHSYTHVFSTYPEPYGYAEVLLYYTAGEGLNGNCQNTASLTVQVVKVESDFIRNLEATPVDFEHCIGIPDKFTNKGRVNNSLALGGMNFLWSFGDGVTSTVQSASYTYPAPGVYTVSLTITEPVAGCNNTAVKSMTIDPNPTVTVSAADSVCKYSAFTLYSNGSPEITEYNWSPAAGLTDPHAQTTSATATTSTAYSLAVVNKYGCKGNSSNQAMVYVQQPPAVHNWDTTIIIGQGITMNTNQGAGFTYTWSPVTDLSCSSCPYPTSSSTVNITYTVDVEDPLTCFRVTNTYTVKVDPLTTVDVPTAFTPNGDGVNDVIYVDGWGIKRLIYFRIFNRWGQLLFESNDIKVGWNGIYNGIPQNMETYIYQVSVETYVPNKSLEKTSSFRLIR